MALTIAHINKPQIEREARALELCEKVLRPKWEEKLKREAEEFFNKKINNDPEKRR